MKKLRFVTRLPLLLLTFGFALDPACGKAAASGTGKCGSVVVVSVSGNVTINSGGMDSRAVSGSVLGVGDKLRTSSGSSAEVRIPDGTILQVGENSHLEPADLDQGPDGCDWGFCFSEGSMQARPGSGGGIPKTRFRVRTPTAVVSVKSPGFSVRVGTDKDNQTVVQSQGGEVLVGPFLEWEETRNPKDPNVAGRFERVTAGRSTSIKRNDKRPAPASR